MALTRLDKFLAEQGLASRKELKKLIKSGRVTVDGQPALRPEQKLDPENSQVRLDGEPLRYARHRYYMMDKPTGVLTATEDARQETVLDLVTPEMRRMGLFPVGRLDKDTSGLLLLTNDGDFAHRVLSPKSVTGGRGSLPERTCPGGRDRLPAGEDGAPWRRPLPGDGEGGEVPPGKTDAGLPGNAGAGAPAAEDRRTGAGRVFGPRRDQGFDGGRFVQTVQW